MLRGTNQGAWLEISKTFVAAPPSDSRLTLIEFSPERFEATYATHAAGVRSCLSMALMIGAFLPLAILAILISVRFPRVPFVFLFFSLCVGIPMAASALMARLFRRTIGGRICLDAQGIHFSRGALVPRSYTFEVDPTSKFDVQDTGDESTHYILHFVVNGQRQTVVSENDLPVKTLRWLSRHLNAWLGWVFPSHCLACGHALDSQDVDWPRRGVVCSVCGFHGRAPDPFPADAVPEPPPSDCPSCQAAIWLTDVNRQTGGCRCRQCGWTSEAEVSLSLDDHESVREFLKTVLGSGLGMVFRKTEYLVPEEELREEFPTIDSVTAHLSEERLLDETDPESQTVVFSHWRTEGLKSFLAGLVVLLAVLTTLMCTVLNSPAGEHIGSRSFGLILCDLGWALGAGLLVSLVWWARKKVVMQFSPYALLLTTGWRERLIAWHTLGAVGVQRKGSLPILLLKHGGTGMILIVPSTKTARALARYCLGHQKKAASKD